MCLIDRRVYSDDYETVTVIVVRAVHEKLFQSSKERITDPILAACAPVEIRIEVDIHFGSTRVLFQNVTPAILGSSN
jgi:hypothetical protein